MGVFDRIFGDNSPTNEKPNVNWIPLTDSSQLEEINFSQNHSVIFKHSTRCGISRFVLKNFERYIADYNRELKLYYLDVLKNRDISNYISQRLDVKHETPQLIILLSLCSIEIVMTTVGAYLVEPIELLSSIGPLTILQTYGWYFIYHMTMMQLMIDRFLQVYLNIKYQLYITFKINNSLLFWGSGSLVLS